MEIIDPRTKNVTFLTLKQMVAEQTPKRALCELEKNEPFMTTENLYIAAESFKISLSPNPNGLVYCDVPAHWFIGCSEVLSPVDPTQLQFKQCKLLDAVRCNLQQEEQTMTVRLQFDQTPNSIFPLNSTVDYDFILQRALRELSKYEITSGTILQFQANQMAAHGPGAPYPSNTRVRLLEDPVLNLVGDGYGAQKLEDINFEYMDFAPATATGNVRYANAMSFRVKQSWHPGLTVNLLKKYISEKTLFLYRADTPHRQQQPQLTIWGPAAIECVEPNFTAVPIPAYVEQAPVTA